MIEEIEECCGRLVAHVASCNEVLRIVRRQDSHRTCEAHKIDRHVQGIVFVSPPCNLLNGAGRECHRKMRMEADGFFHRFEKSRYGMPMGTHQGKYSHDLKEFEIPRAL